MPKTAGRSSRKNLISNCTVRTHSGNFLTAIKSERQAINKVIGLSEVDQLDFLVPVINTVSSRTFFSMLRNPAFFIQEDISFGV